MSAWLFPAFMVPLSSWTLGHIAGGRGLIWVVLYHAGWCGSGKSHRGDDGLAIPINLLVGSHDKNALEHSKYVSQVVWGWISFLDW